MGRRVGAADEDEEGVWRRLLRLAVMKAASCWHESRLEGDWGGDDFWQLRGRQWGLKDRMKLRGGNYAGGDAMWWVEGGKLATKRGKI